MSSTPLEIIVTGDVKGATTSLQTVQAELGKTVIAAQKTDSALDNFSKSVSSSGQALSEVGAASNKTASGFGALASSIPTGGFAALGFALFEVGKHLFDLITAETKAEETQRLLNSAIGQAVASVSAEVIQLQSLVAVAKDSNNSREVQQHAIDKINKTYPELLGNLSAENINTKGVTLAIQEQIKALQDVAKTKALSKLVDTTAADLEAAKQKFKEDKAGGYFHSVDALQDLRTIKALEVRLNTYTEALIKNTQEQNKVIPHTGRLKEIDDELKFLKQQKELHASTLAETQDFNAKIKKLEDERNAIDPKEIKVKATKAEKQKDPFTIALNELQDNLDKAQALVVGQTNIELQNVQDFLEKKKLLLEKFGKDEGKNDLAIAENKRKIFLDEIKFEASQLIPNIKPSDQTDFAKLAIGKIDPTAGMAEAIKAAQRGFKTMLDEERKFAAEFQQIMSTTINDTFSGIGAAIGNAIGTGGNLGQLVFGSLLQTLSSGLEALGKAMIALGTAKIAIENFAIAPGIGTVLAGVAAVALGAILRSAIPHFAGGITNFGGGLALVGERGPEIVSLPRGSNVIPNNQIGASMQSVQVFIPQVTLRGQDMIIAFNRAQQQASRNG